MNNAEGQFISRITKGEDIHKVYKEVFMVNTSKANSMIQEPEIKNTIIERLKADGITEHKIHKTLRKQLDAKKILYVDPKLSRVEIDDNDAQLKATSIGYKLLGLLKDKDVYVDNRQITFSGDPSKLLDIIKEYKEVKQRLTIDITGEIV